MVKITDLPLLATPDGTETVVVVKDGVTRRARNNDLISGAAANRAIAEVFEYIGTGVDVTNPPVLLDSQGRVLRRATDPGVLATITSLIAAVGPGSAVVEAYEYIPAGGPAQVPLVVDPAGRVVLWSSDTAGLSGNLTALAARVSKRSDANGMPLYTPIYAAHRLRRTAMKLRQLSAPFNVAGVQLNMLFQGNSYVDTNAYFIQNTLKGLRAKYGSAGPGYASFGSPDILDPGLFRTQTGTGWTVVDETVPSIDLYLRQSSTVGDTITLTSFASGQPVNYAKLLWTGTADGVIQYRFNGGAWTVLNVQGSGFQSAVLTGIATSSASWTMDFQVVAGTVKLHGVLLKNSASGILMHKAGNNGSTALERATLDGPQQQAAIAALAPDLGVIIDATNDKTAGQSPAQFAASYVVMINNLRAAVPVTGGIPAIDLLLCVENNIVPHASNRSDDYMAAILNVADQYDCAVLSMIDVFGQDPNTYSSWMDTYNSPPGYHPDGASGGYLWVDQLLKIFNA